MVSIIMMIMLCLLWNKTRAPKLKKDSVYMFETVTHPILLWKKFYWYSDRDYLRPVYKACVILSKAPNISYFNFS